MCTPGAAAGNRGCWWCEVCEKAVATSTFSIQPGARKFTRRIRGNEAEISLLSQLSQLLFCLIRFVFLSEVIDACGPYISPPTRLQLCLLSAARLVPRTYRQEILGETTHMHTHTQIDRGRETSQCPWMDGWKPAEWGPIDQCCGNDNKVFVLPGTVQYVTLWHLRNSSPPVCHLIKHTDDTSIKKTALWLCFTA